jgi:hypothetical protein
MKYSNEFFTDIFRILSNRVLECGQSHHDGAAISLRFAKVMHHETTIIPDQFRLEYNNMDYIPEVKQFTANNEVGMQFFYHDDHIEVVFLNNMDVTIVRFHIMKSSQEYLKLKLKHS